MNIRIPKFTLCVLAAALACAACGQSTEQEEAITSPPASADENSVTPQPSADAEATPVSYECPSDELTVIEICLGLTPDQVLAALQDHDEGLPVQQGRGTYDYTDGAQTLRTEPFVTEIRAESDDYRFDGAAGTEMIRTLRWEFPSGRSACYVNSPDQGQGLVSATTGRADPSGAINIAESLAAKGIDDPGQCREVAADSVADFRRG